MKPVKLFCMFALICSVALPLHAASPDESTGRSLVESLYAHMKAGEIGALKAMMPEGFQSIHQDGARSRSQEVSLMKKLHMAGFKISDVAVSRSGNALIVTYAVAAGETIGGERLSEVPAPRMSIFQETDGGWLWIAHANLKPLHSR